MTTATNALVIHGSYSISFNPVKKRIVIIQLRSSLAKLSKFCSESLNKAHNWILSHCRNTSLIISVGQQWRSVSNIFNFEYKCEEGWYPLSLFLIFIHVTSKLILKFGMGWILKKCYHPVIILLSKWKHLATQRDDSVIIHLLIDAVQFLVHSKTQILIVFFFLIHKLNYFLV